MNQLMNGASIVVYGRCDMVGGIDMCNDPSSTVLHAFELIEYNRGRRSNKQSGDVTRVCNIGTLSSAGSYLHLFTGICAQQ